MAQHGGGAFEHLGQSAAYLTNADNERFAISKHSKSSVSSVYPQSVL
jgi:hypothetical protein